MLNVMKSLTGVKQWGVGQGNLTFKQSFQVWGMNLEGIGKNVLSAHTHPRESEMICAIFIHWVQKQNILLNQRMEEEEKTGIWVSGWDLID